MNSALFTVLAMIILIFSGASMADSQDGRYQLVVQFAFDSDVVDQQRYEEDIAKLSELMKAHEWLNVLVLGYADTSGDEHHNDHLSQRRAQAVVNKLVNEHGLSRGRFDAVGLGVSNPVAGNDTREGRNRNRRSTAVVKLPGL